MGKSRAALPEWQPEEIMRQVSFYYIISLFFPAGLQTPFNVGLTVESRIYAKKDSHLAEHLLLQYFPRVILKWVRRQSNTRMP